MKIIVISGHAQHGKDTVGGMLAEELRSRGQRVLVTHFADLLKYICRAFFGWNGEKDERGRHLLQYVGTDVIRKRFPDFWVNFIACILKMFENEWDWVLIPDARFPNEIEKFKEEGFEVTHLRVVRDGFENSLTQEQRNHPSETALDNTPCDIMVKNNGSLPELEKTVKNITEVLHDK